MKVHITPISEDVATLCFSLIIWSSVSQRCINRKVYMKSHSRIMYVHSEFRRILEVQISACLNEIMRQLLKADADRNNTRTQPGQSVALAGLKFWTSLKRSRCVRHKVLLPWSTVSSLLVTELTPLKSWPFFLHRTSRPNLPTYMSAEQCDIEHLLLHTHVTHSAKTSS
jgi:hypothetical protein